MEIRTPLILSTVLIAGMMAVSAWAWPLIPATASIAVHFDLDGRANGWMSRDAALLVIPALATITTLAFAIMPHFTTRKADLAASSAGYVTGWIGTMTVLFVAHCAVILKARGWPVDIVGTASIIAALLFIAIGNVLGKTRPNAYVGVRTPWTRRSDYSWDKSNRAAGRMMVVSGLATLAVLAVAGAKAATIVLIGGIAVMAVVSVILSYIYWRRDPARRSGTGDAQ